MKGKVPETLDEALAYWTKMWKEAEQETKDELLAMTKDDFIGSHHFGIGTWMRNNWGFWKQDSKLYQEMVKLGLHHPDDMSGLILDCAYCQIHGLPLNVEGKVAEYERYWKKQENSLDP